MKERRKKFKIGKTAKLNHSEKKILKVFNLKMNTTTTYFIIRFF